MKSGAPLKLLCRNRSQDGTFYVPSETRNRICRKIADTGICRIPDDSIQFSRWPLFQAQEKHSRKTRKEIFWHAWKGWHRGQSFVRLRAPRSRPHLPEVDVFAVWAIKKAPPETVKPLEWMLRRSTRTSI
jgi:hypothetical protein